MKLKMVNKIQKVSTTQFQSSYMGRLDDGYNMYVSFWDENYHTDWCDYEAVVVFCLICIQIQKSYMEIKSIAWARVKCFHKDSQLNAEWAVGKETLLVFFGSLFSGLLIWLDWISLFGFFFSKSLVVVAPSVELC